MQNLTTRRTTVLIIILTLVVWLLWELPVWLNPIPGDTFSEVIRSWCRQQPLVPFVAGLLCGHWFWPLGDPAPQEAPRVPEA